MKSELFCFMVIKFLQKCLWVSFIPASGAPHSSFCITVLWEVKVWSSCPMCPVRQASMTCLLLECSFCNKMLLLPVIFWKKRMNSAPVMKAKTKMSHIRIDFILTIGDAFHWVFSYVSERKDVRHNFIFFSMLFISSILQGQILISGVL